ncbi:MAG: prepilin-type N-terminal cleavage/methylation domain-containing protein [Planctomycetes bacterium]|nr:prepilin-type N-terminal cleavage/methylation domain-containing protein [Planctomycetota bacterium]
MARRGLTLVELLVVVGAISLLAALSFPALLRVRNQAQGTICAQNVKTLSMAWLFYKDDNDDRLVGGQAGNYPYAWVQSPTGAGTIIERQKEGIRQGALYRYAGSNINVYRCPADQRMSMAGQVAFCSYSIAGGANGEGLANAYVQAEKYSEIAQPAGKYIFVEEADPRGWNRGSWVLNPLTRTWVDPLAIWHSNARSTLGFADGHAEIRRWVDKSTIEMSRRQEFSRPVPRNEGEDLRYMLAGFPQKSSESVSGRTP